MDSIKILSVYFSLAFSSSCLFSQQISGRITKKYSREILIGVTVKNIGRGTYNISDMGGNYRIHASIADSIVFSSVAYLPDTLVVDSTWLTHQMDIGLQPNVQMLSSVVVDERRNFEIDSTQRRVDYRNLYEKKHPIILWNEKRPGDGPGLSFSPLGYFSTHEKATRRLKQRLHEEEEQSYINYKFPPGRVAQITGLRGDSLQKFLVIYRPSYTYCRKATQQDMLIYINDKLIAYRKG
jgi:CarboxypepD_reg-like domain